MQKISLIPMFSYMRSLHTDQTSVKRSSQNYCFQVPNILVHCQVPISLGKNEIYPISIHSGYGKLHLEPGVNHWPMSCTYHCGAADVVSTGHTKDELNLCILL